LVSLICATWNSFCGGQVDRGAGAGIAEIELAGFAPRQLDEFGERFGRHRGIDDGHALIPHREADAFEVLHRVPAGVLVERGVDQHRRSRHQPSVAVGIASRDRRGADVVGAGL
jgi:hypothetical protein